MPLIRPAPLAIALAFSLVSTLAVADEKAACVAASEAGQTSRDARRFEEARRSFLACSALTCPKVVQDSCQQWLGEVMQLQPTVVFSAIDNKGNDLVDVKVLLDGREVQSTITGKALAVDPGPHKVTFQHATMGAVEQSVVVGESQKGRTIQGVFVSKQGADAAKPALSAQPAGSLAPPRADAPPAGASRWGGPALPYVLGGVGVASIVVSSVFFLSYNSKKNSLSTNCRGDGTCPPSEQGTIDAANRSGTISVVAGVVGLAALGAGAWLFLSGHAAPDGAALGASPAGGPDLMLSGRF